MSSVGCFYSCHTHSRYANEEKLILIPFGAPKGGISCNFTMFSGVKLKSERKIICIINNMYWCFNLRNSDIKVLDFCFNVWFWDQNGFFLVFVHSTWCVIDICIYCNWLHYTRIYNHMIWWLNKIQGPKIYMHLPVNKYRKWSFGAQKGYFHINVLHFYSTFDYWYYDVWSELWRKHSCMNL